MSQTKHSFEGGEIKKHFIYLLQRGYILFVL